MDLTKFLESEKSSSEFIEDAVMSSAVSDVTDTPENPVRYKKPEENIVKVN